MGGVPSSARGRAHAEAADKHVLVLGAGLGGASMARIADAAGFRVTVVERRPAMVYKPGGPRAIVDPEWAMAKGLVPLRNLLAGPRSALVHDGVAALDASARTVTLASGSTVRYDYCVLALGSQNLSPADPPPGATSVPALRQHYRGVSAAIRAAKKVVVAGGGLVGLELAGQVRDAVSPDASVTIVHGAAALADGSVPGAEAGALEAFQARLAARCAAAAIGTRLGARVTSLRADGCPGGYRAAADGVPFPVALSTGETLHADLVLWCVGAAPNTTGLVPDAALDPATGLVRVDAQLRVLGLPGDCDGPGGASGRVFAIGDCTSLREPKLSVYAGSRVGKPPGMPLGHADVALANLLELAHGRPASRAWASPPAAVAAIVPLTAAVGGASLGAPHFMAKVKRGPMDYFAAPAWAALGAGKPGAHPAGAEDDERAAGSRPRLASALARAAANERTQGVADVVASAVASASLAGAAPAEHPNNTVPLGGAGLRVPRQGLGLMSLSGGMYTAPDEANSAEFEASALAMLADALELGGGTLFVDTACFYGLGHNEMLLGRFLGRDPSRRARLVIGTKLGVDIVDGHMRMDGSARALKAAVRRSLDRFGTDYIDLVYLNRRDPGIADIADSWRALAECVRDGLVRYLGLSEIAPADVRACHAIHPVSCVQAEWSLFTRDVEADLLPVCRELGIGVVAYAPLCRGLLAGAIASAEQLHAKDFRRAMQPRFSPENLEKNLRLVGAVRALAERKGCTAAQLACAWVHAQGAVPIPGTRSAAHLRENLAAAELELSDAERAELEAAVPLGAVAGERYPPQLMGSGTYHYGAKGGA